MKKSTMVILIGILTMSLFTVSCGQKYSDVKKMNNEFVALVEGYTSDLDKVDNAKDAAKAINRFADGMEKLWPQMQKLSEKYPELKDKDNPPEELKESQKEAEEVGAKMGGSMMKIMAYMRDPEVQKAQQRLGTIMTNQ